MADLDEGLFARQEEARQKREEEEWKKDFFEQRREQARAAVQRIASKQITSAATGTAAKTLAKTGFRAILPYLLPILGVVFTGLGIVILIIVIITTLCGNYTGRLALGTGSSIVFGTNVCDAFQGFQGVASYIDSAKVPETSTK